MSLIKLGIPKGSLEEATIDLFAQAGWRIAARARHYYPEIDDPDIRCALIRAQEMAAYVARGTLDLGLTGLDWILESRAEVEEICTLTYSKASNQPSRWVLVVREDSPIQSIADLAGKKIATELVGFTERYLAERGIKAAVEFSWGATEAKVVEGLVDAIVEITETGSTIRAHGLRIVADLLVTETRLIANRRAMEDPARRAKIEQVALMLQAALRARQKVAIKCNVPAERLETLVDLLPSLHAPTVSHLYDREWLALETIVDAHAVRDLIPKLRAAGAEGILEYHLTKMV
ncbi:ATP phosphoribosyltransferase [Thiocapsa imhoffii]|uniref:ATP phosphoribosyltransferase n=1 Tax=Thiocapsa imhoffii TaxID=382777 RepID=A0A9X1B8V2_9GAMM|nr:ATP phosphoribosyltransferase [Thiocapsa imhoffii]MBK1644420.1 ATP phosphoribosyltransferase [Thiocapsa imhoffii]